MKTILACIGGLIALVSTTVGAIHYFTPMSCHEALCDEFQGFQKQYRAELIQRRIWQLEGYYQCIGEADCSHKMPAHVFQEYRSLKAELRRLIGG